MGFVLKNDGFSGMTCVLPRRLSSECASTGSRMRRKAVGSTRPGAAKTRWRRENTTNSYHGLISGEISDTVLAVAATSAMSAPPEAAATRHLPSVSPPVRGVLQTRRWPPAPTMVIRLKNDDFLLKMMGFDSKLMNFY